MPALGAANRGDEVHPAMLGNPFTGQEPLATAYENGYDYAQAQGHQRLNSATSADVSRWQNSAPAWRQGFVAGCRSLGLVNLATAVDTAGAKTSENYGMDCAIDHLDDAFAGKELQRQKTAAGLLPVAGTVGGALLGGLGGSYLGALTGDEDLARYTHGIPRDQLYAEAADISRMPVIPHDPIGTLGSEAISLAAPDALSQNALGPIAGYGTLGALGGAGAGYLGGKALERRTMPSAL